MPQAVGAANGFPGCRVELLPSNSVAPRQREARLTSTHFPGAPVATLGHAQFFGSSTRKVELAGFTLADMSADPHLTVQRHTHDTAHFIFSRSGAYITTATGAPEVSPRPILVYNPPGTTHRDRYAESNGICEGRFLSLAVSAERTTTLAEDLTLVPNAVRLESPAALALAIRLVRECQSWDGASALVVESVALELLGECAVRVDTERQAAPAWLQRARAMLQDLSVRDLSVDLVARECGVHPVHLARTFRRAFGSSPGHYWRRCRADRAAALLAGSRWSLARVAVECGFADQSHMTHTFRRFYAVSPGEYRRHLQGEAHPVERECFISTRPSESHVA